MNTEDIVETAPEIHLSANSSDTDSIASLVGSTSPLTLEESTQTIDIEGTCCPAEHKETEVQTENETTEHTSLFDGMQQHVIRIKIDLATPLQTILLYLILIFTITYSIYRIVSVFRHVVPIEFFFIILIGIFGFLNFDMTSPCCLPSNI